MLHIYNTLTKQKELFKPLTDGKVGMYVCGITPYDYSHIGHARSFIVFDVVVRYLRYLGYKVKYVRNITDIDDKIINRARENQESIQVLTDRYIEAMEEDSRTLNIVSPDEEPRATEYIPQMITLIQNLLDKGYAYIGNTGDIYYHVHKFESYGCLSHRALEDLQSGARVDINEDKKSPLDFVLWKMAKANEPSWPSPWGEGRPGWHIECSVMTLHTLGETFDIHGGGADLKFPHHENERAQSEAATDKKFVNTWMHVGFVQLEQEKMSKSLGNYLTIRDFLKNYDPEVLRYFTLASHYRSPVDYSSDHINTAIKALERLYTALKGLPDLSLTLPPDHTEFEKRFNGAMQDDFNTPEALAVLFELAREINRLRESDLPAAVALGALLLKLSKIVGVLYRSPEEYLQNLKGKHINREKIEQLIEERLQARTEKNWQESDRIRDYLFSEGIILEDGPSGTQWHTVNAAIGNNGN